MYESEEEYNEAMESQAQAEAEIRAQQADDIYREVDNLQAQQEEIQARINELLGQLP